MDTLVTRTRVTVPRRFPRLVQRERLLNRLTDFLDYRLILVTAPAGYGKTSLLIDFAHHADLPVCWYTVDEFDQDPRLFIAHFLAAIAHRFPQFGQASEAALLASSVNLNIERLVQMIVNEAYQHIRESHLIVLDDYHLAADNETINRFVSRFVQQADENCHLCLASRICPTLPDLPLMISRSQVGLLPSDDLAFRADELKAFALQSYQLSLSDQEAAQLAAETEGWITGVVLSAHARWQGATARLQAARAAGAGLYDYLAQQVLDEQPEPVRDFLLRTSPLEEFDADLCRTVLGSDTDWRTLMDAVLRDDLFVLPVGNGQNWLRYHPLFRDFLEATLVQQRPEEHARILRRLAEVYSERGDWDRACQAARRLGDVAMLTDLVEQAGSALLKSGRCSTLSKWIDELPAATLATRPRLLSLQGGIAVNCGEAGQGLALLNRAAALCRETDDCPCLARTLVRRAVVHRILGDYAASLADAEEAQALSQDDPHLRDIQPEAFRVRGTSLQQLGRLDEAVAWLTRSLADYESLGDPQNIAMLHMELGLAQTNAGQYGQALPHYRQALGYWRESGDLARQAIQLNNLGLLYHLSGEYELALQTLDEALDCARSCSHARTEAYILCSIGDLYAELDAPDTAIEIYRRARDIAQPTGDRFLLVHASLAEAARHRSKRDLASARDLLESARVLLEPAGACFELGVWQMEAGLVALADGNLAQARDHLEEAAQCFAEGGQRVEAIQAHFALALTHHLASDQAAAATSIGHALDLAAGLHSRHPVFVAGRRVRALIESAAGKRAPDPRLTQLHEQIVAFEHNLPSVRRRVRQQNPAIAFAPPTFKFQAFGKPQVTVNGQLISSKDWQAQCARDLVFCLLAHPDGLTKEQIGLIFWPDYSPAQLKTQFKATIRRLRRAIGTQVVLLDKDCYRFNYELDYDYDVARFRENLAQAKAAPQPAYRMAVYHAAIDLYVGPYLHSVDMAWANIERQQLHRAFINALMALAQLYFDAGQPEAVLQHCWRALAQEPGLEEAHRLAMRAFWAMRDRVSLVRQFERCERAVQGATGGSVSAETLTLYKSLTRR